jgi:hypothetical protein
MKNPRQNVERSCFAINVNLLNANVTTLNVSVMILRQGALEARKKPARFIVGID